MNCTLVDQIARALLYEGYILYPYRPSVKNRQRWTFGGLYPRSYCEVPGNTESWFMQTECLVEGNCRSVIEGTVRFLHLMDRRVLELCQPEDGNPDHPGYRFVDSLHVGTELYQSWQESVEREIVLDELAIEKLLDRPQRRLFAFPPCKTVEVVRNAEAREVGYIVRSQQALAGAVEVSAAKVAEGLYRLTVRIENRTRDEPDGAADRDAALMRSFVSTHTLLGVRNGLFVSMLDTPEAWDRAAVACNNVGTWPVLVGADGERDTLLSSPIILYDYPQIAPESPGDLFDSTEIDEILTLRILTMTADEKRQMAAVDDRAGALLQRTEALTADQLAGLHGALRMLRPITGERSHE